jgi:hypothetical protein
MGEQPLMCPLLLTRCYDKALRRFLEGGVILKLKAKKTNDFPTSNRVEIHSRGGWLHLLPLYRVGRGNGHDFYSPLFSFFPYLLFFFNLFFVTFFFNVHTRHGS